MSLVVVQEWMSLVVVQEWMSLVVVQEWMSLVVVTMWMWPIVGWRREKQAAVCHWSGLHLKTQRGKY